MRLLLCEDPLNRSAPDPEFAAEADAASELGIETSLLDYNALVFEGDVARAVRRVKPADPTVTALYRGWMLRAEQYEALYRALVEKDLRLINDPAEYRHCHHLPEWYPALAEYTPESVWVSGPVEELPGDGQVAGLPDRTDLGGFYAETRARIDARAR